MTSADVSSHDVANALAPLTRAAILRPTKREDFASMHPVTQLLGEGVALPARAAAASASLAARVASVSLDATSASSSASLAAAARCSARSRASFAV